MLNCSNSSDNSQGWVYTTLNVTSSILFTIGFPTNAVIIYLVSKHRHLKNATNYFVSSLAVADVMVLIFMLIWIVGTKLIPHSAAQFIYPSIDIFLATTSMLNVASVSADRAIAVTRPLRYERIVTKRRSFTIIFLLWSYSLLILVAGLLRGRFESPVFAKIVLYTGFVDYFIPVCIIIICYVLILLVVIHKLKGSRKLEKLMSYTRYAFKECAEEVSEKKWRRRRKLLREVKVTSNVLLIVVPFTTGWTFFVGTSLHEDLFDTKVSAVHNFFIIIIPWVLSGINPIIYLMANRSLRQTFFETVKKLFKVNDYYLGESRLSIIPSLSRRTSIVHTSSTVVEGNEFINLSSAKHNVYSACHSVSIGSVDRSNKEDISFLTNV